METQVDDDVIDAQARALGLAFELSWKPAVRANLEAILRMAALVDSFPLPDDAEPAPIYRA